MAARTKPQSRVKPPSKRELSGTVAISDTRRRRGRQPKALEYNPDDLVGRKGLRIYDEMMIDEQVEACIALKKAAIVGPGWTLEPSDDSDAAVVLRDEVKDDLDALDEPLDDVLWEVLSAIGYGFSDTEQTWAPDGARLRLTEFRPIAPHDITFETDGYGRITGLSQGGSDGMMPPAKFMHFVNKPEFGNPYGRSDLRCAHRPWWHKINWVQWLSIWGEKLADPPVTSKHPRGTPPEKVQLATNVLENLQARTVLSVPEGWDVGLLLDTRDPKTVFIEVLNFWNAGVAKALFVPDKLGVAGAEVKGGSYSLGETQFDVFLLMLSILQRRLQRCVQRQLIDRMVAFSQPGAEPPQFKLNPPSEDDRAVLAELWTAAVEKGTQIQTIKDVNQWRAWVKMGPISQEEWDAEQQRKMEQAREMAEITAPPGDDDDEPPTGGKPGGGKPGAKDNAATKEDAAKMSRTGFWRSLTKPEERADMAAQRDAIEDGSQRLGLALATGSKALVDDVKQAAQRILAAGSKPNDVRDLAAKTPTFSALRRNVEDELVRAYNRSVTAAGAELRRGRANETMVASVVDKLAAGVLAPLPDNVETMCVVQAQMAVSETNSEAEAWERYSHERPEVTLARPGLIGAAAERFFRAKSFWVTGLLESELLKKAQAVLFNAVKGDKPDRVVMLELDEALHEYVPQADRDGRAVNVPARLETIARTNIAEAQNEARYAAFTDPDLEGVVEALQYSAILDDRVRESHAAWDSVVKPAEWWLGPPSRVPPNSWNCRCTLVPVIAGDDMPSTPDAELPRADVAEVGFK